MSYFNTTHTEGIQLATYTAKAQCQEKAVLEFFVHNEGVRFTPEHINTYVLPDVPLTSVRRALTNLTTERKLTKLSVKTTGKFGRPIHFWALK